MSSKIVQNEEDPFEIYDLDSGRKLLHEYSGIPDEDMRDHIELIVSYDHTYSSVESHLAKA